MALTLKKAKSDKADVAQAPTLSKKAKAEMDKPFVAVLPVANVLSPEVQEVVEQQRLKRLFVGLGVGVVGLVAAGFAAQTGLIAVAENRLEKEQATASDLSAQQAALAPISAFYGQIDANRATIQTTMSKEVLTSDVLSALDAVAPSGVNFTSVTLTLDSGSASTVVSADVAATASACPSQNPYANGLASAGCVSVDGEATSRAALSNWLEAVEEAEAFTVAFIPSTTASSGGRGGVSFSATIGLNAETVYENRYSDPEFLKAGAN